MKDKQFIACGMYAFNDDLRLYRQSDAEFYSDLFPFQNAQNFLVRDKESSKFSSTALGFGASREFGNAWTAIERGSLNLNLDLIRFDYDNFTDLTETGPLGEEPLYSFDATVIRAFASLWF